MPLRLSSVIASSSAVLLMGTATPVLAQRAPTPVHNQTAGTSPALCGAGDVQEPDLQGEVPAGQTAHFNCGVRLLGQLPITGNVQGSGTCAYVRFRGQGTTPDDAPITVIDVRDPAKPVVVGEPLPVRNRTESFRVVVTKERAILVSGSTVYDVRDCLHPKLVGDIVLPDTTLPGVARKNFPHDMRINRAGTKVYYSFGVWEADIANLNDPKSWTLTDHRCELAAQVPGPWQDVHRQANKAGRTLCDDATRAAPQGSGYRMGTSPLVASLLWPQLSHSPDLNADDTRLYVGDQAGGNAALWAPEAKARIIDVSSRPYKILGEVGGGGHGLDWFRVSGRDYILHSNERGVTEFGDSQVNTCHVYPRPTSLGWAYEAFVSDVTQPAQARNVSMLTLAINDPQYCQTHKASVGDASIAYHLIDNPLNARFAAVNYGTAGLRIFDIRDPSKPLEVAYFNHGIPVHAGVGYYDAARKLLYFSDAGGFKVLEIEPQVRAHLGL